MPDVIFNGPEGRLEGRYQHAKRDDAPVALILHPHPQHGGTMNNKVVYSLYHAFSRRGFSTLRFNFRGVGRSQGEFDSGLGELSDAAAALDWMQGHNPNATGCWIAGFSFGAWIAMQLMMRRPEINGFIAIAPPASIHDFSFLAPCPASGLMVHGDSDDIIPEDSVAKLADKLGKQKNITIDYNVVKGCDHFFREHMDTLEKHVEKYLDTNLVPAE
ncbi:alpha/beta hydrolase [Thalassospiraceae bacterium LMO-JJ14]|nr:alpha/beta hydrolase [Thalassospiraceae bacterium LMO-JJ14]